MPDPTGYISIPLELIRGLPWKRPARMASTGNLTLSGLQTVDDVVGVSGDRVLVKDNSDASENGLWTMLSGAWVRVFDMDQDLTSSVPADEVSGTFVYVRDGTVHGGQLWHVTNPDPAVLGTDDINFEQFSGGSGGGASPTDTAAWIPLSDGAGGVIYDAGTGQIIVAFTPI